MMLTLESNPKRRVNPYRLIRQSAVMLWRFLPWSLYAWSVFYALYSNTFVNGSPANVFELVAGLVTFFGTPIIIIGWAARKIESGDLSIHSISDWWERQEAKFDGVED